MVRSMVRACVVLVILSCALPTLAQQAATSANGVVPAMVSFSGALTDVNGTPLAGMVGVTFYLYRDPQGGSPLWLETQNVQADNTGHYKVMLGSTSSRGLPAELFVSGEARWLGVQVQGQAEQPRVLLLSVPYALKAGDAQTVGGLPPSAFVMAIPGNGSSGATVQDGGSAQPINPNLGGSGTTNFIPLWTPNGTTLGNSVFFQSGAGATAKVGLGLTNPLATLDINGITLVRGTLETITKGVATSTKGFKSNAFDQEASSFSSSTSKAVMQHFEWQAEPTGNNTSSPGATLNLLFGTDNNTPAETGLKLSKAGVFTFAPGQTFPGTGDITGVTAGTGLTGGGSSGNVTLSLIKTCSNGQILQWNGSTWVCSSAGAGTITQVNAGTDLTGGGSSGTVTLNLDTTKVPQLAAANSFTNNNTITGAGSGFALVVTQPTATNGQAGTSAVLGVGADADPNGLLAGGVGVTAEGGTGGGANISGAGGNAINAFAGSAGNGNGGVGVSTAGGFGVGGDSVSRGSGGAGVVATGGDSELFFGGDGLDATGGAGGQGNNFASTSGNGVVGTGGQGGFQEADGTGGFFTGGTAGGFGGFGIEVIAGSDSAAFFLGDIIVTGAISAGTKDFKIDHPLDPANKYLYHASIESSEMINLYTGNVTTDAQGDARVQLPDWFEAVNTDFRYQLTVIGQFAQAIVSSRVSNHQFAIKTDKPNVDVSWQITGVRQDAFAKAHPLVVEEDKNARERGFYLHPELYGAPAAKGIAWSHHPDTMRRVKAMQQRPRQERPTRKMAQSGHALAVNAKAR